MEVMVHQGTRHEETAVKEQKFREKDGRIKLPIFVYQKYHKQSDGIRANMGNTQNKYDLKKYFSVWIKSSYKWVKNITTPVEKRERIPSHSSQNCTYECTHTHVRMRAHSCEFNCVTVKTKRCLRKMHWSLLRKIHGWREMVVIMMGQGECNGHSIIMLVDMLIKTSSLENKLQYVCRGLKTYLFWPSNFTSKCPF